MVSKLSERLQKPRAASIAQVEAAMLAGARKAFDFGKYTEITVPHLTKATGACENFDTLFATDYFGEPAYLSQTGQLYLEAFIPTLKKTCCIGPSFRAEPAVDARHLVEFTLLEIELECDLVQLQREVEKIIVSMVREVVDRASAELAFLHVDIAELVKRTEKPFQAITYTEAVKFLGLKWGSDLKSQHEAELVQKIAEGRPLFVTHFPQEIKFFNMRENRENPSVVNSMDLLLPFGGESVGAAEREEDHVRLERRLRDSEMLDKIINRKVSIEGTWTDLEPEERKTRAVELFRWYIDFVKAHPIRHAGCGIGGTRVMQFILGEADIRNATSYPLNRETIL
jgi:asparaginyl-tRNA synthetase